MYQCYHAETRSAAFVFALVGAQSGVEHEQWLVLIQDSAQETNHFLLGRPLITRVVTPTAVANRVASAVARGTVLSLVSVLRRGGMLRSRSLVDSLIVHR